MAHLPSVFGKSRLKPRVCCGSRIVCAAIFPLLFLFLTIATLAGADDVTFEFAGALGCGTNDVGFGIAVDSSGNVYTTGYFESTADFDPGPGVFELTSAGGGDVFIHKLDSAGNFVWAVRLGGVEDDVARGIAVDGSDNVYTTGDFGGTADFDPGAGTAELTSLGGSDIFVCKLDSSGALVWANAAGGTGADRSQSIALDSSDNLYTTGSFVGTVDFDPGPGTLNLSSVGGTADIFVRKLDSAGDFVWAAAMGGTSFDRGREIVTDASGNVYATGFFNNTVDFDPGAGTANLTSAGDWDAFVCKLDSAGGFVWARRVGGTSTDKGVSLAVDASDNVYTAGDFIGTVDFDPGAGTANVAAADRDLFILKLNSLGSFVWVRTMASVSEFSPDEGLGLAVDASGDVFLTADFEGTVDVDPGAGTYNLTAGGVGDVLVEKLDSAGNFVWAKAIGSTTHTGPGREEGLDIAVDALGNVHFTGQFFQTADFDPGAGVANLTAHGENDGFVCKLKYATWVDFAFAGSEIGSEDSPFNSITEALLSAPASTTVFIKGDTADSSSGETIVIDQAVAIEAVNGAVRIGETGAGFGESKASSEFVGRR